MQVSNYGFRCRSTEKSRNLCFCFLNEEAIDKLWKRAKAKGLTYSKIAPIIELRFSRKCSPNTVQGLIKRGEGGEALEKQVRLVLEKFLSPPESVDDGPTKSVVPQRDRLVDAADNISLEEWRRRAIFAEEKLEQFRANVRSAANISEAPLPAPTFSYKQRLSAEQAIAKQQGDADDSARKK